VWGAKKHRLRREQDFSRESKKKKKKKKKKTTKCRVDYIKTQGGWGERGGVGGKRATKSKKLIS